MARQKILRTRSVLVLVCFLLTGCAFRFHEVAPDADIGSYAEPWLIYCETVVSHLPDPGLMPGAKRRRWLVATDSSGQAITIEGKLEEGFFIFEGVSRGALTGSGGSSGVQMKDMRAACLASMGRMGGEKANELAAVRAFRESDSARVSIVFHPRAHRAGIRKFVVFSDSF